MVIRKCQSAGGARAIALAILATLCSLIHSSAQTEATQAVTVEPQDVSRLSPGAKTERQIAKGEVHNYSLTLAAGEFVRVVVEGSGADLVISLEDLQGNSLVRVDTAIGFEPRIRLSFVAGKTGDYRLTLRSERNDPIRRSYSLAVAEWRRGEARDEGAVAAERAFAEAVQSEKQNRVEATSHAIEKYDEALTQWRIAGDRPGEAVTLLRAGLALHNLSRLKEAINRYNQALLIFEQLRDDPGTAHTLTSIGWAYSGSGQPQKALNYCNRALEIRRRIGEPRSIAQTLNLVADSLLALGEQQQAIDRYNEALPLAKAGGDPSIEAYALNGLAWLYVQSGEFKQGLDCVDRALPLWRRVGNVRGEAQSLHLRATIHSNWVYAAEALESFQRAIQIWREVGNRYGEGEVLNNIGVLYQRLGDDERAKETWLQALAIWKAIGNLTRQAGVLNNLGLIEWRQQALQQSLGFFQQSLAIRATAGNRVEQAIPLHNIGAILVLLGQSRQGLDFLKQALKIDLETGQLDSARDVLNALGFVFENLGDEESALENYRRALPASAARGNLARLERKRGNLTEARSLIEDAIASQEKRRERITDQELRVSFGAQSRSIYEEHADILMRLHEKAIAMGQPSETYLTAALESSEQAHARGLLDTIAESRANIRQGADPALIAEERDIQDRLNARDSRRAGLLNVSGKEQQIGAIEKEIQELEWQLGDVRASIRTRSPAYAALTETSPLNIGDIHKLLDDDTLLLEYLLGEDRSFVWAVTTTSVSGYALPGRKVVDGHVRRFYELLRTPSQTSTDGDGSPIRNQKETSAGYNEIQATLSRMLLEPVSTHLAKKRLLIVGDGSLQYVPFAVLNSPAAGRTTGKGSEHLQPSGHRPLIVDHEIINVPSGSVLAALRRDAAVRKPAAKALAVLADPVFSRDDPRVLGTRSLSASETAPSSPVVASPVLPGRNVRELAGEAGFTDFIRLRFSRQEADVITSFLPVKDRLEALDFAASRATAQSQELGDYRILHFATHGLLNSKHPDLSGLVLSLIDEQGRPQNGFLRSHEIYNLKLNADLVVLSGCQTALGKEVRGEGLIGLTRGFMYAGASRVVASLWRVDDRATAELMKRFYRGMLKQGMRPAAALRAAQISMLGDQRWAAPHYWAAFTIEGEWR